MSSVSISTAWNEAVTAVKAHAQLLFPLAFVLVAMPGTILQALIPTTPDGTPQPSMAIFLLFIPAMAVSMIGTLAIVNLVARRDLSGHEALAAGARRVLPLLGALLLLILAMFAIAFPLALLSGLMVDVPANSPTFAGGIVVLLLVLSVLFLLAWCRLLPITAVAALEPIGPIAIIKRSWALTRGHFGKLVGLVLLFMLVTIVISLAVSAVGGILIILAAGPPEPGNLSNFLILLVSAAMNTVVTLYFTATVTRVYLQLAERPTSGI